MHLPIPPPPPPVNEPARRLGHVSASSPSSPLGRTIFARDFNPWKPSPSFIFFARTGERRQPPTQRLCASVVSCFARTAERRQRPTRSADQGYLYEKPKVRPHRAAPARSMATPRSADARAPGDSALMRNPAPHPAPRHPGPHLPSWRPAIDVRSGECQWFDFLAFWRFFPPSAPSAPLREPSPPRHRFRRFRHFSPFGFRRLPLTFAPANVKGFRRSPSSEGQTSKGA